MSRGDTLNYSREELENKPEGELRDLLDNAMKATPMDMLYITTIEEILNDRDKDAKESDRMAHNDGDISDSYADDVKEASNEVNSAGEHDNYGAIDNIAAKMDESIAAELEKEKQEKDAEKAANNKDEENGKVTTKMTMQDFEKKTGIFLVGDQEIARNSGFDKEMTEEQFRQLVSDPKNVKVIMDEGAAVSFLMNDPSGKGWEKAQNDINSIKVALDNGSLDIESYKGSFVAIRDGEKIYDETMDGRISEPDFRGEKSVEKFGMDDENVSNAESEYDEYKDLLLVDKTGLGTSTAIYPLVLAASMANSYSLNYTFGEPEEMEEEEEAPSEPIGEETTTPATPLGESLDDDISGNGVTTQEVQIISTEMGGDNREVEENGGKPKDKEKETDEISLPGGRPPIYS